jgi:uncharacterized membrane protein YdjX (TVP38/TMEM64 family)
MANMKPRSPLFDQLAFPAKCVSVSLALTMLISIPFILFGDDITRWSQTLLSDQSTKIAVVIIVVTLLMLDIVLPIPSSLICIAAYALLDSGTAFVVVTTGLTLTYVFGHIIGATVGLAATKRIFVDAEMAKLAALTAGKRYAAIVLSRPLPVLAEGTSMYLGAIGTPLLPASITALFSSIGLAAMYGWIATSAQGQASIWLTLFASMLLPAGFWLVSKMIRK